MQLYCVFNYIEFKLSKTYLHMFKFVSSKPKNWDHSQILFRLIRYPNFEVLVQKDET